MFVGDTDLYGMDFRYTFAPTGNAREREFILQGEAFWRDEDGQYSVDSGTTFVNHDDSSVGWYAQGVYKFAQKWRAGVRYSELESPDIQAGLVGTGLDGTRHDQGAQASCLTTQIVNSADGVFNTTIMS